MIIPYESLTSLPKETLDNLIKDYLFSQVEDGSFTTMDGDHLKKALLQCHDMLKKGTLIVEYSENDESIGVRHVDQIIR
ncbi:hypothetical protein SOPP22_03725 [Shewanella sp. OPT22]|uniref:YheU family protein n=1 Tax=Parashewanella hymeniacidonis TaxID=2807618 RepID=UPI0010216069|nr:YheU family protein [Parashewanella hymeniacidonis]MBM7070827.1 YheU family protein [Parashewanella hymeniacidonis]RYV03387.1 hypothetical protein SOPP22_03725 [Shewanella sp. OPT22]